MKPSKNLTPEERAQRRHHALRRFKAVAWMVMSNKFWLIDVEEDEKLGQDVKKNIALLLKKKKKSLLTRRDKSILCKEKNYRTDEEKIHINRIIGGLKCFRKYPSDVQMQLAASTYFQYFPPNRVIVRQGREGHALYFIMTGEVSVSIMSFDVIKNEMVTTVIGSMVAGQMFGEVSLLHDIPRTATITTMTDCELLCLMKDDFQMILKSTLQASWDNILTSLKRFTYFDFYDEVAKRECCMYSKLRSYRHNEIIYGAGENSFGNVFFVLKGQCKMIEKLPVIVFRAGGVKQYRLFDKDLYKQEVLANERSAEIIRYASIEAAKQQTQKEHILDHLEFREILQARADDTKLTENLKFLSRLESVSKTELTASKSFIKAQTGYLSNKASRLTLRKPSEEELKSELKSRSTLKSGSIKKAVDECLKSSSRSLPSYEGRAKEASKGKMHAEDLWKEKEENIEDELRDYPAFVKFVFMQVCLFNELACFGLGENLHNRHIVASSPNVELLIIPKYWLLMRNRGNLWTRISQTLNAQIPTTKEIFQIFVQNRKWAYQSRKLVNRIVNKPPYNQFNNVPFSIRLRDDVGCGMKYK